MFFEISENIDFGGYAINNNPYTYCSKIEHVLTNLHRASKKLICQFSESHLVANAGKYYPLILICQLICALPILRSQMWNELNFSE